MRALQLGLGARVICLGRVQVLARRYAVGVQFAQPSEVFLGESEVGGAAARLGLSLAEFGRSKHSQRLPRFHRITRIGEDAHYAAGKGRKHTHGLALVPYQPAGNAQGGGLARLGRFGLDRGELRRARRKHDLVAHQLGRQGLGFFINLVAACRDQRDKENHPQGITHYSSNILVGHAYCSPFDPDCHAARALA